MHLGLGLALLGLNLCTAHPLRRHLQGSAGETLTENATSTDYDDHGEEHAGGHDPIFLLDDINTTLVSLCLCGIIIFTIGLEETLGWIERRLHSHAHYFEMVSKIYKELMILGFISFLLILVESITNLDEESAIAFEFAHIFLFLVALLFVERNVFYFIELKRIKKHWDVISQGSVADLLMRYQKWHASPFFRFSELRLDMEFHVARAFFFETHELSPTFDFSKYLRKSLTREITELMKVNPSTWLVVVSLILLNLGWQTLADQWDTSPKVNIWIFVVCGWLLLSVDVWILSTLQRAKDRFMVKAGCPDVHMLPKVLQDADTRMMQFLSAPSGRLINLEIERLRQSHQELEDIHSTKFEDKIRGLSHVFDHPRLMLRIVDVVQMLQSFYVALLVMHMGHAMVSQLGTSLGAFTIILSLLPILILHLQLSPLVVATYTFLNAVLHVDPEILGVVIERMDESHALRHEICKRLSERLEQVGEQEAGLMRTLQDYDKHNTGVIKRDDLLHWLRAHGVYLTNQMFRQLTRLIDPSQDKYINYADFARVVFHPDNVQVDPAKDDSTRDVLSRLKEIADSADSAMDISAAGAAEQLRSVLIEVKQLYGSLESILGGERLSQDSRSIQHFQALRSQESGRGYFSTRRSLDRVEPTPRRSQDHATRHSFDDRFRFDPSGCPDDLFVRELSAEDLRRNTNTATPRSLSTFGRRHSEELPLRHRENSLVQAQRTLVKARSQELRRSDSANSVNSSGSNLDPFEDGETNLEALIFSMTSPEADSHGSPEARDRHAESALLQQLENPDAVGPGRPRANSSCSLTPSESPLRAISNQRVAPALSSGPDSPTPHGPDQVIPRPGKQVPSLLRAETSDSEGNESDIKRNNLGTIEIEPSKRDKCKI